MIPSIRQASGLLRRGVFLFTLIGAPPSLLTGCDRPPNAEDASPYEACHDFLALEDERQLCADGKTTCRPAPNEFSGMCTTECSVDEDCPSFDGAEVRCDRYARGGALCVLACDLDADDDSCAAGTTCTEMDRVNDEDELGLCMP